MPITFKQKQKLSHNININLNTIIQLLGAIECKESDSATTKRDKTMLIFLGCIAMALTTQNEIDLLNAEETRIIQPN
jgi:hypothetical protein